MPTLIFDQDCPYCKAVSVIAEKTAPVETVPYQSETAQEMLEDSFEDPGFTMYLFKDQNVYWGKEAARRVAYLDIIPFFVLWPAVRFYPQLRKVFSMLSDRAQIQKPACSSESCQINHENGGIKKLN
jgi:predicted DCC family thiol-disulfide oxidoreductase YuxK